MEFHSILQLHFLALTLPTQRAKLRKELNPYTEKLIAALNQFIDDAKKKLPADKQRLVLIADGLEKVTLITNEGGRSNHEEIFIDRAEQLKGLACDVIYTVPISLALSRRATDLLEIYDGTLPVLPMIMTHTRDNDGFAEGIKKLQQIIRMRVDSIEAAKGLALETGVFDNAETLNQLCLMSGGHVRNLVLLVQTAIKYNEEESLPIDADALQQAIRQLRKTYRDTVDSDQWDLLAGVHSTKQIINNDKHRSLLFTRCLLEYCEEESWHDVHPLLKDVSEFKTALEQMQDQTKRSREQVNDP